MKKLALLALVFLPSFIFPQTIDWIKTVGDIQNTNGQFVRTDAQGNAYVCGTAQGTCNFGHDTLVSVNAFTFVAKYDSNGNNLWAVQYAAPVNSTGVTVGGFQVNSIGEPYFVGYVTMGSPYGVVVHFQSTGAIASQVQIPGNTEYIWFMDFDSHNNYVIAGDLFSPSLNREQSFIASYNASDSLLWNVFTYSTNYFCPAHTSDNGFFLEGTFEDTLTLSDRYSHSVNLQAQDILSTDQFLAKYDSVGHLVWAQNYSDENSAAQMVVDKATDALYILESDMDGNDHLTTYDAQGNQGWNKLIVDSTYTIYPQLWSPQLIGNGGSLYLVGGGGEVTVSGSPVGSFILNRYDLNGNLTGKLASPTNVTAVNYGLAFAGNSMILTGGVAGSGTWDNQSVSGNGAGVFKIFTAKMGEDNISPISTGIEAITNAEVSVYPNPSNGEFYMSFENETNGETQISITDMVGRNVYAESFASGIGSVTHSVKAGNLATGVYVVTLRTNQKSSNQKIVIK